jgi:CotH protein/lamin tail-like protein/Big-like domain-containing protein/thrombospondin type 3 repeat protein/immunoglobulin I-set domain protein
MMLCCRRLWCRVILLLSLASFFGFSTLQAQLRITEFMASNTGTLADEDGDFEDWIEVQNNSPATINLFNWSLTDKSGDLTQWRFPSTNLPPGGFLVVFASGKNRRTPGASLHANFKLDADGEYLALVDPTGTNMVTQFSPEFPGQVSDVSYGLALTVSNATLVAAGATARVLVPSVANGGSALNYNWTGASEPFNAATWPGGATGVGFPAGADVGFNIQTVMLNSNASAFIRISFVVNNPTNYSLLTLRQKYNDGFVAWLNGVPVAQANAPAEDLNWNSAALAAHTSSAFEDVVLGAGTLLQTGTNILAIQGLNIASANNSFLVLPELIGTTVAGETAGLYFTQPTPGAENIGGAAQPGPGIANVKHTPNLPLENDNIIVTAKVFPTAQAVSPATVTLHYRVMYGSEINVTMLDNGASGDGAAGDGIYGATIPASASVSGQMVRYYITAADVNSTAARLPVFTDPVSTAQYLGTVINADSVTSSIPVFQLFIDPVNQGGADSQGGSRCAFYFDGELYDNIGINLRGNTTGGYAKKSHHLEFNREHKLRHPGPGGRVRHTSLMAEFIDPMYLRHYLSFWLLDQAGHNAPYHYPVRVQNNGAFYQFAYLEETLGDEQLERFGFDPNGVLYKAVGILTSPPCSTGGGPEKKTRTWEPGTADYDALANALSSGLPVLNRKINVFDMLDLPDVINYMACMRLTHEDDDTWANMSIYRDSDGDQLWRIIPFDLNLSWGQSYANSSIQANNDNFRSHPFWGGSSVYSGGGCGFNRLYDAIVQVPETRQMLLRRTRTVMDKFLQPPGTPASQSLLMQQISTLTNQIWANAFLDRQTWGWPPNSGPYAWGPNLWLTNGVNDFIAQYLIPRRVHLYGTHSVTNTAKPIGLANSNNAGIPVTQPTNLVIGISGFDFNPASGNQEEEYVQLSNANSLAVDISGWELDGGIHFKFKSGTVMPANSVLYVSPNVRAFRNRTTGPRGSLGLFVTGPYSGRLNAWGESLTLTDDRDRLVSSNSFVGAPSPAQRYLRVTEIMYNPSAAPAITNDAQQFEYIEIKNISTNVTLNLAGVRFTNGIFFNFTGGAVTSLAPQQAVLLVRSQPAFTARYGGGPLVAGQFTGALDSGGETLRLEDAVGEKILEFAYNNSWYPITDGLGFSLVIVNENASWDTWDKKSSWRPSGGLNGSPGVVDPLPPVFSPVIVNEVLTHTDLPQLDSVELFNPNTNAVNIGGWFLTDDFFTPKKYRIINGTTIPAKSYLVFNENQFNTGANAFRFSELGEFVYLFSGDAGTNLTGYYHGYEFGEAPNGVSFGRYTNSQGDVHFVLESGVSLATNNAYPRVGPIVISEIMYRPPDTNGADNDLDEFIELQNVAATNVSLFDPGATTNRWRLRNAVDFDFPAGQSLAAGARLLVVGFNPTNAVQLAAFRTRYGVSNSVAVFGPWSGKLDNSGETIELKQPGPPDDTQVVPFYMIDKVAYTDETPWPAGADGIGNSLQRAVPSAYGNDPANWFAAGISAGRATVPDAAPAVSIASPTNGAPVISTNGVTISVVAGDSDGSISSVKLLADGGILGQWSATVSNYFWSGPPAGSHELQAIATDNLGAITVSTSITIQVTAPLPTVAITFPTNGAILVAGSTVTLTANAVSGGSGGPASSVDYFLDGSLLGNVGPPFALDWAAGPAGSHVLSAVAYDATGQASEAHAVPAFVQAVSANPVMFSMGASAWKYLDNGSNQGTGWIVPALNDSSWSNGVAILGFGGNGEVTTVRRLNGQGTTNVTIYLRKKFVVPTLNGITGGALTVMRDDGAIAYLNGVEIFRNNMPASGVTFTTFSSENVSGSGPENAQYTTNFSPGLLTVGTNTFAIEVHNSSLGSTDLSIDAALSLQGSWLGPAFIAQPADQSVSSGGNATFAVSTAGTQPIFYRWYFNGAATAATNNTLTVTNAQAAHVGPYFVVASNMVGVVTSSVVNLTITGAADTDGDGMPDAWEQANGTNPLVNDANADPDQDRLTNLQEFIAGTSPTNAMSVLKILGAGISGTNLVFYFNAISNRGYTVQLQPAIGGSWQKWQDVLAASSNRVLWLTNGGGTNRFFRVVTPVQP